MQKFRGNLYKIQNFLLHKTAQSASSLQKVGEDMSPVHPAIEAHGCVLIGWEPVAYIIVSFVG